MGDGDKADPFTPAHNETPRKGRAHKKAEGGGGQGAAELRPKLSEPHLSGPAGCKVTIVACDARMHVIARQTVKA